MKKIGLMLLLVGSWLYAHTLLVNVIDNGDDSMTVVGEFSTGELAAGALVRLESLVSGEVLFRQRLPEESELTLPIPSEPYQVVLDGGPGHQVVRRGIPPKEGFSVSVDAQNVPKLSQPKDGNEAWSMPVIFFFCASWVLFGVGLMFSAKNTKRILREVHQAQG